MHNEDVPRHLFGGTHQGVGAGVAMVKVAIGAEIKAGAAGCSSAINTRGGDISVESHCSSYAEASNPGITRT